MRPQRLRHQVDAFGGAADEDDFAASTCAFRKRFDLGARLLVGRGGALAQLVHAAVDIGAIHFVEVA